MKKKKKKKKDGAAATPSLKDCANCGAPEGKVYGVTVHRPCSKCGITYYCSVICQKHHWKEGGHKKHCVAKEERSAASSAAAAAEPSARSVDPIRSAAEPTENRVRFRSRTKGAGAWARRRHWQSHG